MLEINFDAGSIYQDYYNMVANLIESHRVCLTKPTPACGKGF